MRSRHGWKLGFGRLMVLSQKMSTFSWWSNWLRKRNRKMRNGGDGWWKFGGLDLEMVSFDCWFVVEEDLTNVNHPYLSHLPLLRCSSLVAFPVWNPKKSLFTPNIYHHHHLYHYYHHLFMDLPKNLAFAGDDFDTSFTFCFMF